MADDNPIQTHMNHFLQTREPPKTFCPSEVARALTPSELSSLGFDEWRAAMESVRNLAEEKRSQGSLEVLQKGAVIAAGVAIRDLKGPIRLRQTQA